MIRTLTVAFFLTFTTLVASQDLHFTLYDITPLTFNPAYTGGFYGSVRLSAIYRDQWATVVGVGDAYRTPVLSADAPIMKGFRDQDWVGVGINMISDRAGALGLGVSSQKISAAYHFAIDKKGQSTLSLGYQTGSVQRRIKNQEAAIFETSILGGGMNPNGMQFQEKKSYVVHNGGLRFNTKLTETNTLHIGVSVSHIGEPDGRLVNQGGQYKIPMRYVAQAGFRTLLTERVALAPSLFYQTEGPAQEMQAQAIASYLLNPEKKVVVNGGAGYRFGDSAQLIAGVDFDALRILFAYDINVSSLSAASGTVGGFELGLTYIAKIYKRPDPDPAVFCPRF